jgi:hypothetical protein
MAIPENEFPPSLPIMLMRTPPCDTSAGMALVWKLSSWLSPSSRYMPMIWPAPSPSVVFMPSS